jgi:hypothetical protein
MKPIRRRLFDVAAVLAALAGSNLELPPIFEGRAPEWRTAYRRSRRQSPMRFELE